MHSLRFLTIFIFSTVNFIFVGVLTVKVSFTLLFAERTRVFRDVFRNERVLRPNVVYAT